MLTVAVAAQKGGVGKTTVALNLALSVARRGWRVLLVDADPQGGIGRSLQEGLSDRAGLVDCLLDDRSLPEVVLHTRLERLHLLPVGPTRMARAAEWEPALRDGAALAALWRQGEGAYDLILVDTPSGMYGATFALLGTVGSVLLPMQAEPLALRTLAEVLDCIVELRRAGSGAELAAVLLTMVKAHDRTSLDVAREVWSSLPGSLVLETVVPRDDTLLEASARGVPVGLLSRRPPPVAAVFDQIAAELEPRLGLDLLREGEEDEPIPLLD